MSLGDAQIPYWLEQEVQDYDIPLKVHPRTVLDIGANVGAFSLRSAERWPGAKIFAYEPIPELVTEYLARCGNGKFFINEVAIRAFSGVASINKGRVNFTSSFYDYGEQTPEKLEVKCLDAAALPQADFVKVDTEGCEVEIVNRLNLDQTQAIACEYHTSQDEREITSICEDRGFIRYRRIPYCDRQGVLKFIRPDTELENPTTKLFIGLPIYGNVDPRFFCCALKLMANFPVNCHVRPVMGDSLIPRARNNLTMKFLRSDCTHMLMIDSDLVFSNDHIKRILSHDEDVVGGFYPKKKEGTVELVCNALDRPLPMDERRLLPLKGIGTGFICVKRRVFEKMIEVYGDQIAYLSDDDQKTIEYDLWPSGVYHYKGKHWPRYLSEDWYFCQRALELGYKVYGDCGITLRHSGTAVYPLETQLDELFRKQPVVPTVASDSAAAGCVPSPATVAAA